MKDHKDMTKEEFAETLCQAKEVVSQTRYDYEWMWCPHMQEWVKCKDTIPVNFFVALHPKMVEEITNGDETWAEALAEEFKDRLTAAIYEHQHTKEGNPNGT